MATVGPGRKVFGRCKKFSIDIWSKNTEFGIQELEEKQARTTKGGYGIPLGRNEILLRGRKYSGKVEQNEQNRQRTQNRIGKKKNEGSPIKIRNKTMRGGLYLLRYY